MTHGTRTCYTHHGCRCRPCRRANAAYSRHRLGRCHDDCAICNQVVVLTDFPIALIARQAWPDDKAAIAAAFSNGVGFAAAADPGSAARPVSQPPGDRAGRATSGEVSWQSRCRTCRSTKGIYSEDGQWTCSRCGDEWQVPET